MQTHLGAQLQNFKPGRSRCLAQSTCGKECPATGEIPSYRKADRKKLLAASVDGIRAGLSEGDQSLLHGKQDEVGVAMKVERLLDVVFVELHSFLAHTQDTGDLL